MNRRGVNPQLISPGAKPQILNPTLQLPNLYPKSETLSAATTQDLAAMVSLLKDSRLDLEPKPCSFLSRSRKQ